MITDLSVLQISSALARHAGRAHGVVSDNISRMDIPGSTALRAPSFSEALHAIADGNELSATDTGKPVSMDHEMVEMARAGGQHQAAITIWSKTLEMIRLAGATPR